METKYKQKRTSVEKPVKIETCKTICRELRKAGEKIWFKKCQVSEKERWYEDSQVKEKRLRQFWKEIEVLEKTIMKEFGIRNNIKRVKLGKRDNMKRVTISKVEEKRDNWERESS